MEGIPREAAGAGVGTREWDECQAPPRPLPCIPCPPDAATPRRALLLACLPYPPPAPQPSAETAPPRPPPTSLPFCCPQCGRDSNPLLPLAHTLATLPPRGWLCPRNSVVTSPPYLSSPDSPSSSLNPGQSNCPQHHSCSPHPSPSSPPRWAVSEPITLVPGSSTPFSAPSRSRCGHSSLRRALPDRSVLRGSLCCLVSLDPPALSRQPDPNFPPFFPISSRAP